MKTCKYCGKEIVGGRKDKIYCSLKCGRDSLNNKIIHLSIRLKPHQIQEILTLQEKFLRENTLEELNNHGG